MKTKKPNLSSSQEAILYARVSSKEQEKEGYSIPAQQKLLRDYAHTQGLQIVKEFIDVETAKESGRENFSEMTAFFQKELENKSTLRCRTLLVEKTDRLYRNLPDYVLIDNLDLEIHLVKEGEIFSKNSRSTQKFFHGMKVLMAKQYIDNLSEEVKKGMLEKAEQGIYPSVAPLGYLNVESNGRKFIVRDKEKYLLIKRVFKAYATGTHSLRSIVKFANDIGLRSSKGHKLSKASLQKILQNPIYFGRFVWKAKVYSGVHDPIISEQIFEDVQNIMASRNTGQIRPKQYEWAFSKLLRCGNCNGIMSAEKKKGRYVYYHCSGKDLKCPQKYVREEEIARQFGEALGLIRIDHNTANWIIAALKESHTEKREFHDSSISNLQGQYTKLQNRIDQAYVDKLDGRISAEVFDLKSQEWRKEQLEITNAIHAHQSADHSFMDEGAKILELSQKAVILYERQNLEEKRKILEFVFQNSLWVDGKLIPVFRKPFDLLAVTNAEVQMLDKQKVSENAKIEKWRGGRDSNPRPPA